MAERKRRDFETSSRQVAALLAVAKGLGLTQGRLTENGIEMIFEQNDRRTEVRILPQVHAADRNILDPINDMTLVLEVKDFRLSARGNGSPILETFFDERIELPFSTWFNEGDYI